MSDASKALAPCLWLIASETETGEIPANTQDLAWRLRMPLKKLLGSLNELKNHGFIEDASNVLAVCKQNGVSEIEVEREIETEAEREHAQHKPLSVPVSAFDQFWETYPRRIGKIAAEKAWRAHVRDEAQVIAGVKAWKESGEWVERKYIPYPATFLNQERWSEAPRKEEGNGNKPAVDRQPGVESHGRRALTGFVRDVRSVRDGGEAEGLGDKTAKLDARAS